MSEGVEPMKTLVCIQCAMKALLAGETPPTFDETAEEHMRKHHRDPISTKVERIELEKKLASNLAKEEGY
jgi:hypothetical protein